MLELGMQPRRSIQNRRAWIMLLTGDLISLALVTLVGFSTHGETAAGARMLTTFLPLVLAWGLTAPFLRAYDLARIGDWRQLWRPFYAMILAGPLAAFLRGFWLNASILPIFVVVLGGFAALGLLAWRVVFVFGIAPRL
jgi:hypothetical protein